MSTSRKGVAAVIAMILVVGLVLLGETWLNRSLPEVAVYGDSLLLPATNPLQAASAKSADVTVRAYPGADLPLWAEQIKVTKPSRLVLALGTNDARLQGVGPFEDLLSSLPSSTCVVWPRPYRATDQIAAFDAAMDPLLARHPNVRVIDWASQVAAHPEYLLPDGLHYNDAGAKAYASMLFLAVEECVNSRS